MFTWFRKRLTNWLIAEPYDLYRPKERLIYSYWNGQRIVQADPMTLYKRAMSIGPELDIDIRVAHSASKDAGKAHEAMLIKIRNIFDVKPLAENGLTEIETINLLDHFMAFNETLKKKWKPVLTSSNNLGDSEPPLADNLVTENGTPYTSAAAESSTSKVAPLPTESPSPSV